MSRVSGTRVFSAHDDERRRCLLFSDLHLPDTQSAVFTKFTRILDDAMSRPLETRVLILGDLFEFWIGPSQIRSEVGEEVTKIFRRCSAAGLSITVLHGNRDFMLDQSFAAAGALRVVAGGLSFRLGDRRCIALHGDELCWNDRPYQRSKRVLRNPLVRLVLRSLPLGTAMALGRRARAKSQQSIRQGDQSRFAPVREAISSVLGRDFDLLIFGHIHESARGVHDDQGEYCILPAFDESGIHLEAEDGRLSYRDLEGRILPDAKARSFPPFQG